MAEYSAVSAALRQVAREHAITPWAARVLLAIAEEGGTTASTWLYASIAGETQSHGHDQTQIRRSLLELYKAALVDGNDIVGRKRGRGRISRVSLTSYGHSVVEDLHEAIEGNLEAITAARGSLDLRSVA